ncbi:hypothetical protein AX14_011104 [Amanita brunnescens Koide BX004]|nr:hypothetical protein AX14_011104 [Amanita brunnescens Koide BX004]
MDDEHEIGSNGSILDDNNDIDIVDIISELPCLPDEDIPEAAPKVDAYPEVDAQDWDIEEYPLASAGAPFAAAPANNECNQIKPGTDQIYAPFGSKMDWDFTQWAKSETVSTSALTRLLSIDGITEALGLSYKNPRELNSIIDCQLPGCPSFKTHDISVGGELFMVMLNSPPVLYSSQNAIINMAQDAPNPEYIMICTSVIGGGRFSSGGFEARRNSSATYCINQLYTGDFVWK